MKYFGFLISVVMAVWHPLYAGARNVCWDTEDLCVISAKLYSGHLAEVSLNIDCLKVEEKVPGGLMEQKLKNSFALRRFEHIQNVTLNGCHALLNVTTYGFEFLPNCDSILHATVEHFYGDSLQLFQCHDPMHLEVLKFRNNEIATIGANAFVNLKMLHELHLQKNCLRYANRLAIESLRELEVLHIEEEFCLSIKEGDFFKFTSITDLRLFMLKRIPNNLTEHLPETLRYLSIEDMRIANSDADAEGQIMLTNPMAIRNVSIINCSLNSFTLNDSYDTVAHLNLSNNAIKYFEAIFSGSNCALQTLDLSGNKLTYMRKEWLRNLTCLERINLSNNNLKQLSLHELLASFPGPARYVDLRANSLRSLQDAITKETFGAGFDCDLTHVLVDHNPWDCMWLLNFTHINPDKFRMFQYQKFISKINVNGLECRAADLELNREIPGTKAFDNKITNGTGHAVPSMNATTYTLVYGTGRDSKRNQRAEALIIVFMLPLGIAILFVLLYMWIYCQKVFHWSYYRSIPIGRKTPAADRFDVIRQIPPTTNTDMGTVGEADYEIPLTGGTSVCDCTQIGNGGCGAGDKILCRKSHHITYETLPDEAPHKLYEEIIATSEEQCTADFGHPFYDHLTYVEALQNK